MHYAGQTHTVAVPLPIVSAALDTDNPLVTAQLVRAAFESAYRRAFSRLLPGHAIRIVSLRTTAIARRPHFDLRALAPAATASLAAARRGARDVWLQGRWHTTAIWSRLELPVGARIAGPAILEQPDATTLIEPGFGAVVDDLGNLVIREDAS